MTRISTKKAIETIGRALKRAFQTADCPEDIEPVFREAAEGEGDGGGVKYHGWKPFGLPGAKFHAMTGQSESNNDVRRSRADGKSFRNHTVLNREDYYDSFEQYNNFKI